MIRLPASTLPSALIIAASIAAYAFWLAPVLETAQRENARLTATAQTTAPNTDTTILARLAAPAAEDDAIIRSLTALAKDVQTNYTLGPWQSTTIANHPHQQRRLDLTVTSASDTQLWPLIHALATRLPHVTTIDSIRIARSGDTAVTGTITLTLSRADL